MIFEFQQAIGDSGQGFFNAIIFCFFNKKIRQSYKESVMKCFRCRKRQDKEEGHSFSSDADGINETDTVTAIGIESEVQEDPNHTGSHELAKPYTKKWKEQSSSFKEKQ